ncbi:MAG TPA: acylphosphatase [Acetobacteraceae bacterium]|nr:acylphosphatase [Acetobacteraceae bacterium]
MSAKRVVISGRVQGVGYRDWMASRARALGLDGWVRNRSDGTVEALVAGEADAVEELLRRCRRGPRLAEVAAIVEELADPPEAPGFVRAPDL